MRSCLVRQAFPVVCALFCLALAGPAAPCQEASEGNHPRGFRYIDTSFENASPLYWNVRDDGVVDVYLLYDHERSSPNRAAGHWHFNIEAAPGSDLTLELHNFDNVWNGKHGCPVSEQTVSVVSDNGEQWRTIPTDFLEEPNRLRLNLRIEGASLYVARMEPYSLTHLDRLKRRIADREGTEIQVIGRTVQGRALEMIRVGDPEAKRSVVLRGRAHPWEAGGNWVLEGLLDRLSKDDPAARRWRSEFCVYVMPMANKDGVARGWTRFNTAGKDLNRNWDAPADSKRAPENHALETWLTSRIEDGRRPDLLIDFHNDQHGRLHLGRPALEDQVLAEYLASMTRLETLLRKHTWFTEGHTAPSFRNPGSITGGVLARYGIPTVVHELNADFIAGLDSPTSAEAWKTYGAQLPLVFSEFFGQASPRTK